MIYTTSVNIQNQVWDIVWLCKITFRKATGDNDMVITKSE